MAKKSNTKYRRRRALAVVVVLTLVIYSSVSIVSGALEIREQRRQLSDLAAQITQQRLQNEELERLLNDGDLAAQLERVAREKLGYAEPDERLYIDAAN